MPNIVFIGTSLDGYISDKDGGLEFLHSIPNPEQDDLGYLDFMDGIDALLMGRKTYETVLGFGGQWPYHKPVFVLSNTLSSLPDHLQEKVELVNGSIRHVVEKINGRGFEQLYIDGGKLIQSFLKEDMIDKIIITQVPILLGGGTPLFGDLPAHLTFELVGTKALLNAMVQSHYKRIK
jgi:dihydrofolate reductase